jgi:hypothetical protein
MNTSKPYLTKFGLARWWFYCDTKRKWKSRVRTFGGWPLIVVSYRKSEDP